MRPLAGARRGGRGIVRDDTIRRLTLPFHPPHALCLPKVAMPGLVLLAVLATLVGLFAPAYLAPTPVAADTYTVQPGDTASTIAAHIGIPTYLLLALNPQVQSPSLLLVGQILTVPDGSTLPPLTTPAPPPTTAPAAAELLHTVQPGDTLSSIAARYDVSTDFLLALNPGLNPDLIIVGTTIVVLSQGDAPTTPSPTPPAPTDDDPALAPYRVLSGDTYSGIASRFGLTQAQLFTLNPTTPPNALLRVGDLLFVPADAFLAFQAGQPLPLPVEPAPPPPAPAPDEPPATPRTIYVVQPGDTALAIAQLHGLSLSELLVLNPSLDPNLIGVGQVIVVPDVPPNPANVEARPGGPTTYTIQAGDTLGDIAARAGLTIDQLLALNPSVNPDLITPGTTLLLPVPPPTPISSGTFITETGDFLEFVAADAGVLPTTLIANNPGLDLTALIPAGTILNLPSIEGVQITVQAGDTLAAIAAIHGSTVDAILADPRNAGLNPAALIIGQQIVVPVPIPLFLWPVDGEISDFFGICRDDCTRRHNGLDIASLGSTDVYAVAGGIVTFVGGAVCCGLGLYVEINHGGGWVSRYAHLAFLGTVAEGQVVGQGTVVGAAGCTGFCTGVHLHLEFAHNGWLVDPLNYLP